MGFRVASALARAVPGPVARVLGAALGPVFSLAMRSRRTMLERHLRRVHGPGLTNAELRRQVQRSFRSYARYWVESFRLPGTPFAELDAGISINGLDHLKDSRAAGRGVILALPHLGGWEHGGAWLSAAGHGRFMVVVEPLTPPELFEWFAGLRRAIGMEVVPLGPDAGSLVLRHLREGGIVALLCDRDITGSGVTVSFFGEDTTLPSGPATLALRTGAALLPAAVYFDGPRRHLGVVGPPLTVERSGRFRDDIGRLTQSLAGELEVLIRRCPEQWHLFQPNWPSDRSSTA